ncbi:RICIN domain-containing protein [Streptomyces chartreusis]|uniref:RICIN domain-containing protein n=1 Tax=Streptomyces chartreusis TaxID=1969 RepID=UPI0033D2CD6E
MLRRSSRTISSLILCFLTAVGLIMANALPAAAVNPTDPEHRAPAGAVYKFMSSHANWTNGSQVMLGQVTSQVKYVTSSQNSAPSGQASIQAESQSWEWIPDVPGNSITAGWGQLRNRSSGQCLDVSAASTADGAQVIPYTCSSQDNQRWKAVNLGGGGLDYQLVAKHSNKAIGSAATDCVALNSSGVWQLPSSSGDCLKWRVDKIGYRWASQQMNGNDGTDYSCISGYHLNWNEVVDEEEGWVVYAKTESLMGGSHYAYANNNNSPSYVGSSEHFGSGTYQYRMFCYPNP